MTRLLAPALALALGLAPALLPAQITLTDATLPEAGASFTYVVDTTYAGEGLLEPGGAQTWIFADVQEEARSCTLYRTAAEGTVGDSVTGADLVATVDASCNPAANTGEAYLRRDGGDLRVVAIGTGQPLFPLVRLGTPLAYQRAPFTLGDEVSVQASEGFTFGGEVLAAVPGAEELAGVVDSVRVALTFSTTLTADAWGQAGPDAEDLREVLRVRRAAVTDQVIEVLVPLLGWIDPTTLPGIPPDLIPSAAQDIVSYEWWTADRAAPLYRAFVEEGEVASVEVASEVFASALAEVAPAGEGVAVRSGADAVTVSLAEAPGGTWRVSLLATDGRVLAGETAAGRAADLATGGYPAGLYLVRVELPGRAAVTRRILLTR